MREQKARSKSKNHGGRKAWTKVTPRLSAPRCPYCGTVAVRGHASDVKPNGSPDEEVWYCPRKGCDAYVTVNKSNPTLPVTLARADLRLLRREAHYWFNKVLSLKLLPESYAYSSLKRVLRNKDPHFGVLREDDCRTAIEYLRSMTVATPAWRALAPEQKIPPTEYERRRKSQTDNTRRMSPAADAAAAVA